MRRFAVVVAASLIATMLVAASPAAATQATGSTPSNTYQPPPIAWTICDSGIARYGAECGFVVVPLDYSNPGGPTIQLAVSRIKHTVADDQYQGIMLTNPGGPGGSGLIYSILGGFVPNGAGNYYDWIGFDPRGVGSSIPSLSCDSSYSVAPRPQFIPYTKSLEQTWLDRSKGYARACAAAGGELLNHVRTTDSVQDMDSIRKALGQAQLNFYGFSYGTYLGQVYNTLYPKNVRRMVLDGVVDPTRVWYPANLDQDLAFDKNMDVYFRWLATNDGRFHLGSDWQKIKRAYYVQYAKLSIQPLDGFGPDELNDVMLGAGYYVFGWVDIGLAFAALVNDGDVGALKAMYDDANPQEPGGDNSYAMYLATQCTDVAWPTNWNRWRLDNWATFARAPFLTWNNAWFNAPCVFWSAPSSTPVRINGSSAPPILLISETKDAATPYSGALTVRSLFPKSILIEGVGGTTHAGSLSGVSCTDDTIASYLATGALPARQAGKRSDVQCDPVPPPDPNADQNLARAQAADRDVLTELREHTAAR